MPVTPTYPGVYVEEVPSGVRTITGVSTAITAFIGRAVKGPVDTPVRIQSFADYDRTFGGLSLDSPMSFAVSHFFLNGGTDAVIVRVYRRPANNNTGLATVTPTEVDAVASQGTLTITAQPADGETITIDAKTYTLQDTLTDADGNIQIGGDRAATQANIAAAVNLTGTAGTDYAASMTAHPTVEAASAWTGDDLVLTARTAGAAGDTIATTETMAGPNNEFDAATLGTTRAGADATASAMVLESAYPGAWGNNLRLSIDHDIGDPGDTDAFNVTLAEIDPALPATAPAVRTEQFFNVSVNASSPLHVDRVLAQRSQLARVRTTATTRPSGTGNALVPFTGGSDGQAVLDAQISDAGLAADKEGIWALDDVDLFNILCIPPLTFAADIGSGTRDAALAYCKDRRAFFILDAPAAWNDVPAAVAGVDALNLRDENVAVYFPRVRMANPLRANQVTSFAPCGVVAGLYARTDARRGVWKAPAGQEATMRGVRALEVKMTDGENGLLNPLGVNCLRTFPVIGPVVWGARTLEGADALASEWKYVPVRRTALYIEESLYRGLQWVVFEPNDEPLWAQIRLNVGSFMNTLFRQGAFQGSTPSEAYFVKCDSETTTQADIDRGIVNILVGFAPLKPAEFVFIKIQQLAGQIQT